MSDKILPKGQSTFEKPHDDHVVGQADGVGVVLEGVGEGQRDAEDGEVALLYETTKDLWQPNQSGEKLQ